MGICAVFRDCNKGRPKLFMQDNDHSQNSALAYTAWKRSGARLVNFLREVVTFILSRIFFHIVKMALEKDALDKNITQGTFQEFSECIATTFHNFDTALIDKTIESVN